MSVFDVYEESFKEAAEVANAYVANGEGDVTLAAAWEAVKSADEAARSMDTECAGNFELKVKVTGYKKELDSLKRDMEAVQRKKDREALLSGNTMQEGEEESADYSRVIQGQTNRIDRQVCVVCKVKDGWALGKKRRNFLEKKYISEMLKINQSDYCCVEIIQKKKKSEVATTLSVYQFIKINMNRCAVNV